MRTSASVRRFCSIGMSTKSFFGSTEVVLGPKAVQNLENLRKAMGSTKAAKLIVVSDFDHTLTKFTSLQCHDVVGYHKDFSSSFTEEYRGSFLLPFGSLAEWWRYTHDLIVDKSGLTKTMFHERLSEGRVHARSGFGQLAVTLRENNCPFIIVSAGFKDIIHHTMAQLNASVEHDHLFHIDANYLEFAECGKISGVLPEVPVHSRSKHEVAVRAAHMFAFIHDAQSFESDISASESTTSVLMPLTSSDENIAMVSNTGPSTELEVAAHLQSTISTANSTTSPVVAIVMGDRPPDFDVLNAFPTIQQFRVGFARTFAETDVQPLLTEGCCDVVLVGHEHGLEALQLLIDDLISLRSQAAE